MHNRQPARLPDSNGRRISALLGPDLRDYSIRGDDVDTTEPQQIKLAGLPSRISLDALTIRIDDTVDFLHQLINSHLASGDFRPEQLVEELDSVQSRDLGPLTLGDPSLAIPSMAAARRSLPRAAGVPAKRFSTSSGNSIVKVLVPFAVLMTSTPWLPLP